MLRHLATSRAISQLPAALGATPSHQLYSYSSHLLHFYCLYFFNFMWHSKMFYSDFTCVLMLSSFSISLPQLKIYINWLFIVMEYEDKKEHILWKEWKKWLEMIISCEFTGRRTVGVNGHVANWEWIPGWRKIFKDHQLDVTSDGAQTASTWSN